MTKSHLNSDRNRRIALTVITVLLIISVDQFSKNLIRTNIGILEKVAVIEPYISFLRVENSGAFLSSGEDVEQGKKYLFLTLFPSIGLLITLVISIYRNKQLAYCTSLGLNLLIGGGISNIIDRFIYKSVTDFIHISIGPIKMGIFNIADTAIFIGMILLLRHILTRKSQLKQAALN